MNADDPEELFARLAVELNAAPAVGVENTARRLVEIIQLTIGCSHVGLSLTERGRLEVVAASDPWVEHLDRVQLETGDGPLVTAFSYDCVVSVRDAPSDPRWSTWSEAVGGAGVRTVVEVPLRARDRTVGVLGLYDAAAFSADDREIAQTVARYVAEIVVSTVQHPAGFTR